MIHSCGSFPNLIKMVWVLIAKLQNKDIMVNAIHHYLKGGTKGQELKNPNFLYFLISITLFLTSVQVILVFYCCLFCVYSNGRHIFLEDTCTTSRSLKICTPKPQ